MNTAYILNKLSSDRLRNANIINFIEDYGITRFEESGNSLMVKGTSDREWIYFSSTNEDEFRILVSKLGPDDNNFAVLEDWMLPVLSEMESIKIELTTVKLFYPEYLQIPETSETIIPLSPKDAEYIYNNYTYKKYTTPEYIRERIIKGSGASIRINNILAAWILTQDDGAIGILHVLDEYRRRGFAKELTYYMMKNVRSKGRIPFVQIEKTNLKSYQLAKKIGFMEDRIVNWAYRANNSQ